MNEETHSIVEEGPEMNTAERFAELVRRYGENP